MSGPLSTYAWQQARAECLRRHGPIPTCWLCGEPIDMTLPWRHPMSASVDHVQPRQHGGALLDQANLRPAHRTHNVSRGNRTRLTKPKRSRSW